MKVTIKDLIEDGFSISRVEKIIGIDKKLIKNLLLRTKWTMIKEDFSEDKIERICQLYKDGISSRKLGIKFSIDKRKVQEWAKERGYIKNNNPTNINEHAMDIIDTPVKAYWLGFFYAKGYNATTVNSFRIKENNTNLLHLEKCADLFSLPKEKIVSKLNYAGKYISTLILYSKHICTKMTEFGCISTKGYFRKYPTWLDESLHSHFVRGLFDGNGSLQYNIVNNEWKLYLESTNELIFYINSLTNIDFSISSKKHTCSLMLLDLKEINKFCDWLYKDSTSEIRLESNYIKYNCLSQKDYNLDKTSSNNENIRKLIEDGFSHSKIAFMLNLDKNFITNLAFKNKWSLVKEEFNNFHIEKIIKLYEEGVSAKQLGIKFSIDKRRVQKWVDKKGLLRSKNESHRIVHFNEHVMDEIDTPTKAYWLGFFYADAYNSDTNNTFKITLKGSDHSHLEKCAEFFELPKDQVIFEINNEEYSTTHISFYSKHLCTKMTEYGCPRAKSFIIKYPTWLNDSLRSHFIRGLFDGDGCLSLRIKQKEWKWSLTSTEDVCKHIKDYLKNINNINTCLYNISKTGNNTYNLEITGNQQIKRFCDWLYQDTTPDIRLDRKYDKYQELCKQQEERVYCGTANTRKYDLDIKAICERGNVFSDAYTVKCMLGPLSKNFENYNGIFKWQVNKTNHCILVNNYKLTEDDLNYLSQFESINYHYMSEDNIKFLGKHVKSLDKSRYLGIIVGIDKIDYSGNKNKTIRNYMNRYKSFEVQDQFKSINDIKELINRWSETLGEKYFRDFSGKNKFFFENNFHVDCESIFVYDGSKLIAFGVASPVDQGYCSYIIGKALSKDYPGLAEFTDMKLYEKLYNKYGSFKINMGQSVGGLTFYKKKFPNSEEVIHYNGKIKAF